jgi:hypothetical protein
LVTSSVIENQKLILMFDAVSAHTDCLIQIVKERCDVVAAGVEFYSTADSSQALFSEAFIEPPTGLAVLPLARSMEAHYREITQAGKGLVAIKS